MHRFNERGPKGSRTAGRKATRRRNLHPADFSWRGVIKIRISAGLRTTPPFSPGRHFLRGFDQTDFQRRVRALFQPSRRRRPDRPCRDHAPWARPSRHAERRQISRPPGASGGRRHGRGSGCSSFGTRIGASLSLVNARRCLTHDLSLQAVFFLHERARDAPRRWAAHRRAGRGARIVRFCRFGAPPFETLSPRPDASRRRSFRSEAA